MADKLKPNSSPPGGRRKNSGRKPKVIRDLVSSWKSDTVSVDAIMKKLLELATGTSVVLGDDGKPLKIEVDGPTMVAAAREYLNRVLGKPKQQIEMKVDNAELADLYREALVGLKTGELNELLEHRPVERAAIAAKAKPAAVPSKKSKR